MRTTINLDEEVLSAAKAKVRMSGKSLGNIVSEWARVGMMGNRQVRIKTSSALPTFSVRKNAPMIPSDRAAELLDEEA